MQRRESNKSYYFSRAMEKESSGALSMKKMNGELFACFVENNYDAMCMLARTGTSPSWILGGDPSQNCVSEQNMLERRGSQLLNILTSAQKPGH